MKVRVLSEIYALPHAELILAFQDPVVTLYFCLHFSLYN